MSTFEKLNFYHMKGINIIFWILAVIIGSQSVLFLFRGLSAISYVDGLDRWMWIFKVLTYFGIIGMGILLFKLKGAFQRSNFFIHNNVKQLRSFAFLGLATALMNSAANSCMETHQYFQKEMSLAEAQYRLYLSFAEHVFDHSLVAYVLVLSIILLTYFVQNAIEVKGENEAFI